MISFLTDTVTWWHWVILGLFFIIAEMATGTFITLGFGLAAILVGLIDLLIQTNILIQLLLWILFSVAIITLLFKYFKRQPTVSKTGQSDFGLDTPGTVTAAIAPHHRGKVRFDTPVLGNTLWHATSDTSIQTGERVSIVEVQGQLIKVAPLSSQETPSSQ